MKVAVVGTGISGLVVAHRLDPLHDVTVYEAADYVGGHTNTVRVEVGGRPWHVDTGFIVHNDRTYPNFIALMRELGVETRPTSMSFSVKDDRSGVEWASRDLDGFFAQRRNLVRPSHLRMLAEILRFNHEAPKLLDAPDQELTLGAYLGRGGYSQTFVDRYIVPMGAAIWSTEPSLMMAFPAVFFVRFLYNHGMLTLTDKPTWRVLAGGSHTYVRAIVAGLRKPIRTRTPVVGMTRFDDRVEIKDAHGQVESFDEVVIATHSDTALRLLADPSDEEKEILGALPYQRNKAVLHTDERVLPGEKRAWASWNYRIPRDRRDGVAVTYDMNILQGLDAPVTFCVSLNERGIDESRVLREIDYDHPLFTVEGVRAQKRYAEIGGKRRTHYAGAYWAYGFHEDGVVSGLRVVKAFGGRS
ncbi:MAG: FAD-dependent oxidoreductase [Polyangiales bacterium]